MLSERAGPELDSGRRPPGPQLLGRGGAGPESQTSAAGARVPVASGRRRRAYPGMACADVSPTATLPAGTRTSWSAAGCRAGWRWPPPGPPPPRSSCPRRRYPQGRFPAPT